MPPRDSRTASDVALQKRGRRLSERDKQLLKGGFTVRKALADVARYRTTPAAKVDEKVGRALAKVIGTGLDFTIPVTPNNLRSLRGSKDALVRGEGSKRQQLEMAMMLGAGAGALYDPARYGSPPLREQKLLHATVTNFDRLRPNKARPGAVVSAAGSYTNTLPSRVGQANYMGVSKASSAPLLTARVPRSRAAETMDRLRREHYEIVSEVDQVYHGRKVSRAMERHGLDGDKEITTIRYRRAAQPQIRPLRVREGTRVLDLQAELDPGERVAAFKETLRAIRLLDRSGLYPKHGRPYGLLADPANRRETNELPVHTARVRETDASKVKDRLVEHGYQIVSEKRVGNPYRDTGNITNRKFPADASHQEILYRKQAPAESWTPVGAAPALLEHAPTHTEVFDDTRSTGRVVERLRPKLAAEFANVRTGEDLVRVLKETFDSQYRDFGAYDSPHPMAGDEAGLPFNSRTILQRLGYDAAVIPNFQQQGPNAVEVIAFAENALEPFHNRANYSRPVEGVATIRRIEQGLTRQGREKPKPAEEDPYHALHPSRKVEGALGAEIPGFPLRKTLRTLRQAPPGGLAEIPYSDELSLYVSSGKQRSFYLGARGRTSRELQPGVDPIEALDPISAREFLNRLADTRSGGSRTNAWGDLLRPPSPDEIQHRLLRPLATTSEQKQALQYLYEKEIARIDKEWNRVRSMIESDDYTPVSSSKRRDLVLNFSAVRQRRKQTEENMRQLQKDPDSIRAVYAIARYSEEVRRRAKMEGRHVVPGDQLAEDIAPYNFSEYLFPDELAAETGLDKVRSRTDGSFALVLRDGAGTREIEIDKDSFLIYAAEAIGMQADAMGRTASKFEQLQQAPKTAELLPILSHDGPIRLQMPNDSPGSTRSVRELAVVNGEPVLRDYYNQEAVFPLTREAKHGYARLLGIMRRYRPGQRIKFPLFEHDVGLSARPQAVFAYGRGGDFVSYREWANGTRIKGSETRLSPLEWEKEVTFFENLTAREEELAPDMEELEAFMRDERNLPTWAQGQGMRVSAGTRVPRRNELGSGVTHVYSHSRDGVPLGAFATPPQVEEYFDPGHLALIVKNAQEKFGRHPEETLDDIQMNLNTVWENMRPDAVTPMGPEVPGTRMRMTRTDADHRDWLRLGGFDNPRDPRRQPWMLNAGLERLLRGTQPGQG